MSNLKSEMQNLKTYSYPHIPPPFSGEGKREGGFEF